MKHGGSPAMVGFLQSDNCVSFLVKRVVVVSLREKGERNSKRQATTYHYQ